eukprot:TRINITY_DN66302_c13_g2_i1.p1 TRINITY_DN66302_c13_g2~~TRINITY_DN66302_c13_g2_i1.p1  ORF type:complete len:639 (-),score=357.51 TRINITY_DN66302_c13_g2_i1:81-1997(-)
MAPPQLWLNNRRNKADDSSDVSDGNLVDDVDQPSLSSSSSSSSSTGASSSSSTSSSSSSSSSASSSSKKPMLNAHHPPSTLSLMPSFSPVATAVLIMSASVFLGWWNFNSLPFAKHGWVAGIMLCLSGMIQSLLAIYGLNSFFLAYCSVMAGPSVGEAQRTLHAFRRSGQEWPLVTVQLPVYNERYVIERLIKAAVELDYPVDKLEIQVLDDSTDGTTDLVRRVISEQRLRTNIRLTHITRRSRTHFKAGALALGTASAHGEFLAIFDADFVPERDFLKLSIPRFFVSPKIGCVQCRWGHLNYDHSMFTKLQAIGHDGHFVIEQFAKCKSGVPLNFNGTAGVWRRECIVDAGDWSGDTLAEDLDLSYRAQLKGWKVDYLRDVVVPAEVPLSISAFKKQQARWAKGSIQTALKLYKRVYYSRVLTPMAKVQAFIHLFGYSVHPLMFFNLLITSTLFFLTPVRADYYLLMLTVAVAFGPPLVVACAQIYLGRTHRMALMPLLVLLHHGLCVSNTMAVFEAVRGIRGSFERTPKFGQLQEQNRWAGTQYARALKSVGFPTYEIIMSALIITIISTGLMADVEVNQTTYPWLCFFLIGFLMIIALHVIEYVGLVSAKRQSASSKAKLINSVGVGAGKSIGAN